MICPPDGKAKKILLINPSPKRAETSKKVMRYDPPVALINLATHLRDSGFECEIANTSIDDIDYAAIADGRYLLAGFTILIGDFLKNAAVISAKIRETNPSLPIVWGGVMASMYPDEILKRYPVDYVVRYEGEYTLHELTALLASGAPALNKILGLSYRDGETILHNPPRHLENNLDSFPVPDWRLLGPGKINEREIPYYFRIMSSKGCPYNCTFCYKHSVDADLRDKSPVWRFRSAEHVIAEIDAIHEHTGARVFTFGDDNFLVAKRRTVEVMAHLRRRGFYIEQCIAHMNNLNDESIAAMSGIVQTVIYAIESSSPRLLKLVNKKLNPDRAPGINQKLFDAGITTTHNFIIGLPTETDEDLKANVDLMVRLKQINPYVRSVAYLFMPLPSTPISDYITREMGLSLPSSLDDYECACYDRFDPDSLRFRPWLSPERFDFLNRYRMVFDDSFQTSNLTPSEQTVSILDEDPALAALFASLENVRRPKTYYLPYVLDRVLNNEKIDLVNDIKALL